MHRKMCSVGITQLLRSTLLLFFADESLRVLPTGSGYEARCGQFFQCRALPRHRKRDGPGSRTVHTRPRPVADHGGTAVVGYCAEMKLYRASLLSLIFNISMRPRRIYCTVAALEPRPPFADSPAFCSSHVAFFMSQRRRDVSARRCVGANKLRIRVGHHECPGNGGRAQRCRSGEESSAGGSGTIQHGLRRPLVHGAAE